MPVLDRLRLTKLDELAAGLQQAIAHSPEDFRMEQLPREDVKQWMAVGQRREQFQFERQPQRKRWLVAIA